MKIGLYRVYVGEEYCLAAYEDSISLSSTTTKEGKEVSFQLIHYTEEGTKKQDILKLHKDSLSDPSYVCNENL